MKVFTESIVSEMKKVNEKSSSGALCVVEGPCMEFGKVNRNNRIYSEKLIRDRILNNPSIQEAIRNKSMLGEGGHPSDRIDVSYPDVALSVEKLWIPDDSKNLLWCRLSILDTPIGKILNSLVQYGSKIGISARAMADSTTKEGHEIIDENTYELITFDAVPEPGFKVARLSKVEAVGKCVSSMTINELQTASSALKTLRIPAFESRIREIDNELVSRLKVETNLCGEGGIISQLKDIRESLRCIKDSVVKEAAFSPDNMKVLIDTISAITTKVRSRVDSLNRENERLSCDKEELLKRLEKSSQLNSSLSNNKVDKESTKCEKKVISKIIDFNRDPKSLVSCQKSLVNESSDILTRIIDKQFGGVK